MIKDRRMGRFKVDIAVINDSPEIVRRLMSDCIILKAEYSFTGHNVEYLALCDDFLEVPEGVTAPEYDIEYDGETDTVTWVLPEAT